MTQTFYALGVAVAVIGVAIATAYLTAGDCSTATRVTIGKMIVAGCERIP